MKVKLHNEAPKLENGFRPSLYTKSSEQTVVRDNAERVINKNIGTSLNMRMSFDFIYKEYSISTVVGCESQTRSC